MIVIIDYGLGNLGSVKNTLDKLGVDSMISKSRKYIEKASGLILPGVGSASEGMKNLRKSGLDKIIIKKIQKGKPFLGICLGMQLLFSYSEEGKTSCLNVIAGTVKKFNVGFKIPQIGWNQIKYQKSNIKNQRLFDKIPDRSYFYFVHSYYCQPKKNRLSVGQTDYGKKFCSILTINNIVATQFHPEKSGRVGQQFIINWIKQYGN